MSPTTTPSPVAAPRRPRRRWLAPVLVLLALALLAVGLVVADGVAEEAFEQQAAERVQQSIGTSALPQVDATGRPFLTQLVAGDVEHLRVRTDRTTLTGPGAEPLTVHLRSPDRFTTTTAERLTGSADVGYAEISRLAGREVTAGESSGAGTRWVVSADTEVFGLRVPVQVSGLPVLDGGSGRQLALTDTRLSVADYDVPRAVAAQIITAVVRPVPLELPLDLAADAVRSTPDGLTVDFSGEDVPLS